MFYFDIIYCCYSVINVFIIKQKIFNKNCKTSLFLHVYYFWIITIYNKKNKYNIINKNNKNNHIHTKLTNLNNNKQINVAIIFAIYFSLIFELIYIR